MPAASTNRVNLELRSQGRVSEFGHTTLKKRRKKIFAPKTNKKLFSSSSGLQEQELLLLQRQVFRLTRRRMMNPQTRFDSGRTDSRQDNHYVTDQF